MGGHARVSPHVGAPLLRRCLAAPKRAELLGEVGDVDALIVEEARRLRVHALNGQSPRPRQPALDAFVRRGVPFVLDVDERAAEAEVPEQRHVAEGGGGGLERIWPLRQLGRARYAPTDDTGLKTKKLRTGRGAQLHRAVGAGGGRSGGGDGRERRRSRRRSRGSGRSGREAKAGGGGGRSQDG